MNKLKCLIWLVVIFSSSINAKPFEVIGKRDNMYEIEMPADNNCLFWAVAAGNNLANGNSLRHRLAERQRNLRNLVVQKYQTGEYDEELAIVLTSDENEFNNKDDYLKAISDNYWGGEIEILAMSNILQKNITVHMKNVIPIKYPYGTPYKKFVHVFYNGSHYNLLSEIKP